MLAAALIHSTAAVAVASVAVVAADMVADPDAAFSLSLPPPRPTPKHFRLLPPTQLSKTLKNLFSHVSTKKLSLIYWIRGGRFVCSFRNLCTHFL